MAEYLCKCSNCGAVMYDENPDTTQKQIDTSTINEPILPMELLNEEGDSYYGCGNCQTDSYLIDYGDDVFFSLDDDERIVEDSREVLIYLLIMFTVSLLVLMN